MSAPQDKPSQATQGNGPAAKYRNERVRALGHLLATGADPWYIRSRLAALHLEPLDRVLTLEAELDELTYAQSGAPDLRSEERLRRVRRALRLEGETIDLLNRASRSFLACLGY